MGRLATLLAVAVTLASLGCGGGSSPRTPTQSRPPTTTAGLSLSPASATVPLGGSKTFSARVTSGTLPALTWSVNGVVGGNAAVGTITTGGRYTAPATFPDNNHVTVTATATNDASRKASAGVTVVYPNTAARAQTGAIKLGTSGGNNTDLTATMCCSGTLGALLRRDGKLFILSNNHVIGKSDKGEAGDPIGQPGLVDTNCSAGRVVAHLSQKAPLKTSNVDAALAEIVSGEVDTSGSILALGDAGSSSIQPAPPSATLADAGAVLANGTNVAKSGRSSGLTCSTLSSVSTSVQVDYEASCGGAHAFTVTFTNQVVVAGGSFSAGGDSGALIVTADNARPVALLYAGNDTNTIGNPMDDVLRALRHPDTGAQPAVVGGGDHPVSCAPTATLASASTGASAAALPMPELERARETRERFAATLMSDPAITGVGVGRSADAPGRAAITIFVTGTPLRPIPQELEGVRTQVIPVAAFTPRSAEDARADAQRKPLHHQELLRGIAVKEQHAQALLQQEGILGVGVGRSADAPEEAALIVYVERGKPHAAVPATIGGVRTRTVEGGRFHAFGWNEPARPRACKTPRTPARR